MPIDFNKEDLKPQGLARNLANGKRISGSSAGSRPGTISAKSQAGDATSVILGSNPGIDENFQLLFLPAIQDTNTDTKV